MNLSPSKLTDNPLYRLFAITRVTSSGGSMPEACFIHPLLLQCSLLYCFFSVGPAQQFDKITNKGHPLPSG